MSQADEIVAAAASRAKRRIDAGGDWTRPYCPKKRNHKKRHSVNRERSRDDARKATEGHAKSQARVARRRAISAVMHAYFAGEIADLSPIAKLLRP